MLNYTIHKSKLSELFLSVGSGLILTIPGSVHGGFFWLFRLFFCLPFQHYPISATSFERVILFHVIYKIALLYRIQQHSTRAAT